MTEQSGRRLVEHPARRIGPRLRQLLIAETGVHASYCVVAAHVIASDQPEQLAGSGDGTRAARLAAHERARDLRYAFEQTIERLVVEVMHEQIREYDVAAEALVADPTSRRRRRRPRRRANRAGGSLRACSGRRRAADPAARLSNRAIAARGCEQDAAWRSHRRHRARRAGAGDSRRRSGRELAARSRASP